MSLDVSLVRTKWVSYDEGKTHTKEDEYVYPSVVDGYSAYCPELDEDLYDMEWTRIDHKNGER